MNSTTPCASPVVQVCKRCATVHRCLQAWKAWVGVDAALGFSRATSFEQQVGPRVGVEWTRGVAYPVTHGVIRIGCLYVWLISEARTHVGLL